MVKCSHQVYAECLESIQKSLLENVQHQQGEENLLVSLFSIFNTLLGSIDERQRERMHSKCQVKYLIRNMNMAHL